MGAGPDLWRGVWYPTSYNLLWCSISYNKGQSQENWWRWKLTKLETPPQTSALAWRDIRFGGGEVLVLDTGLWWRLGGLTWDERWMMDENIKTKKQRIQRWIDLLVRVTNSLWLPTKGLRLVIWHWRQVASTKLCSVEVPYGLLVIGEV